MTAVTVVAPFVVFHDGNRHEPGETVEVPDATARDWYANGWVEKPKPAKAAPARSTRSSK